MPVVIRAGIANGYTATELTRIYLAISVAQYYNYVCRNCTPNVAI